MDWKLLGAIFRNWQASLLLVLCAVAAGYALSSSSLALQILAALVAVAAFAGAVRLVRRP